MPKGSVLCNVIIFTFCMNKINVENLTKGKNSTKNHRSFKFIRQSAVVFVYNFIPCFLSECCDETHIP